MRVFVSEYITSGALLGDDLPESLLREGRAMRDAVLADLAAVPGVRTLATCDPRVPLPSGVESRTVNSRDDEAVAFEFLCSSADATLVIAPELDGVMLRRVRMAGGLCRRVLNARPEAVELCSDKLALWERLQAAGVPAIATASFDAPRLPTFPAVVKPRFGAGSHGISVCSGADALTAELKTYPAAALPEQQAIVQPFVRGRACSVAALFSVETPGTVELLPVAEQHLSDDGRLQYLGGQLPASGFKPGSSLFAAVHDLVAAAARAVPGLRGYIGFDFLLPDEAPTTPLLVEINPRLTTSYVGYRALCRQNLAACWLHEASATLRWADGAVRYSPSGAIERLSTSHPRAAARAAS